jgi:hypothetical protein
LLNITAGKYLPAIELYTRAIELTPGNAVLYANRAFANIKTEAFGYAIRDATATRNENTLTTNTHTSLTN